MTIMLRQTGIPARLVNGFRTGEYNSIGSSWTVRQYDAHSWVEAYFPPYGWVAFDPTPPDPDRSQFSVFKVISNLVDAVDLWWFEEVVNYDTLKQVRMAVSARKQVLSLHELVRHLLEGWFSRGREKIDSLDLRRILTSRPLLLALLFLCFGGAILIAFLGSHGFGRRGLLFRLRRALAGGDGAVIIVSFYEEALDLLHGHGLARTRGQTPLEFALSIGREPISRSLVSLTEIYNRIRFGCRQSPEDLSRAEALLADLKTALQ